MDGFISEKARKGVFFVLCFFFLQHLRKFPPPFIFWKDLCTQPQRASARICDVIKIYCLELLHGQRNQTLCIFIQCLLDISHTNKPPFAVALWVMIQECAPLSPENYPGWCLCHAFHFCVVILQGVHLARCVIRGVRGGALGCGRP